MLFNLLFTYGFQQLLALALSIVVNLCTLFKEVVAKLLSLTTSCSLNMQRLSGTITSTAEITLKKLRKKIDENCTNQAFVK